MAELLDNKDFWRLSVLGDCPLPLNQAWTYYMYQVGILWIEESQVCLYKPEDREELRNVSNLAEWTGALQQYCTRLGVRFPNNEGDISILDLKQIFQSLLKRAIEEQYADAAQSGNIALVPAGEELIVRDCHQEYAGISEKMFQVISSMTSDQADFNDVRALMGRQANVEEALQIIASKTIPAQATPDDFVIKKPSAMITARLIAQKKLSEIQFLVNDCLSNLQLQTADPKADYRLGKVGI